MSPWMRVVPFWLALAVVLAACAPPSSGDSSAQRVNEPANPAAFKRITAAIRAAPVSLVQERGRGGGTVRGLDGVQELAHAGLTYLKADGLRAAQLAEAVPTIENGLWRLLPDGRMQTPGRSSRPPAGTTARP